MTRAILTICLQCDGRGFQWKAGDVRSRRTGEQWQSHVVQGDRCSHCKGTGEAGILLASRYFAYITIGLAVMVLIFNLIR